MGKSHPRDRGGGTAVLSSFPSPSPSSSSSSSDFEFTISLSPTSRLSSQQCPADELFYKGKLLPLHLSPRISMVRTLLLASSSTSSDSTATTASRDSTASSSSTSSSSSDLPEPDSSRPSSATEDDLKRPRRPNYFSSIATRFSSVFKKHEPDTLPLPTKKTTYTTKQVIKKYVKKMKPIYERLSSLPQKQQTAQNSESLQNQKKTFSFSIRRDRSVPVKKESVYSNVNSFSGNLRYPKRNRCAGSCPSSMRSSPTHSGVLSAKPLDEMHRSGSSSMEDLQNAIQGAIAHCKSTMGQAKVR